MKCEHCRFAPPPDSEGFTDECPHFAEHGKVWKDGQDGCTLSYQTLQKWENEYLRHIGLEGTDQGIQMDFEQNGWSVDKAVSDMKHMIGLDMLKHKPYTRHGNKFFRPYRNYWAGHNKYLEYLSGAVGIIHKYELKSQDEMPYYTITDFGREWLSDKIGVKIWPERD